MTELRAATAGAAPVMMALRLVWQAGRATCKGQSLMPTPPQPYKIGAFLLQGEVEGVEVEVEVPHFLRIRAHGVAKVGTAAVLCLVSRLTPVLGDTAAIAPGDAMGGIAVLPHLAMQTILAYPGIATTLGLPRRNKTVSLPEGVFDGCGLRNSNRLLKSGLTERCFLSCRSTVSISFMKM